ncbi:testis-expressed protein 264-like [Megalops cyprinoides]|uniref:testis-expressed protein 264-like n=1 Tax=Megalops cyprinoides TaxID=118141 RepID=UPI001863FCD6|nr:testis-expressed protein 264-like [Megalops cyprinoides]
MSDMLILALIILFLLSLLVTVVGFVLYSGLLSEITIGTGSPPIKNITIAYKYKVGPYKDCGALFTESCSIGPKLNCIGVFYDNPKTYPAEKCRCAVGSILSEGDEQPDEELVRLYEKFGFKVFSFPEVTHAVTTSFPNRTPISFLLGMYRVYPQLWRYVKERKLCAHPLMEIYKDQLIYYMCPLARQSDFSVPEMDDTEKKLQGREESEEDRQTEITGADSCSEVSSVSHTVMSESRETSLAPSTVPTLLDQEPRDSDSQSDRSGIAESEDSGSSFEELDFEPVKGQENEDGPQAKEVTGTDPEVLADEQATVGEGEE